MEKTFNPQAIETKWYQFWEENDFFAPKGSEKPYCIMIPPPNVTGSLHMGHAFQDTIMDTLIRYHRMKGCKTLWQTGTDHAGIATQMVVERQLNEKGTSRHELGRDAFIEKIWDWKATSGGRISDQLRRLGASVDWKNERFTMDEGLSNAVNEVFVTLFREGLIYRGQRLVNWDPILKTAISDLEVVSEEEQGSLWHIKYPLEGSNEFIVVATTRPETMLGDSAVAVHPLDERYQHLIGKKVILPLTDRTIPIVADDYVDPEFGSGAVKITPAHDFNDYQVGERHQLPLINILNDDATLNDNAPEEVRGLDRFEARQKMVEALKEKGLLVKIDAHTLKVPRGDRTQSVIEPFLTQQWFVKADALAKPAMDAVRKGDVRFVPQHWEKTYFQWLENIEDWCISRQLWWGHRIPAWYGDDGTIYVGHSEEEVRSHYQLKQDVLLRQDDDVLDTWFSSALWPFSTLGWPESTERFNAFYPTQVLVTGFDIIFFWVARMIMMGLHFTGKVPFRDVYMHGLIRDAEGQKMSKSKGNVLDPIDLVDGIELEDLVKKRTSGLMQPQKAPAIEKATRKHFPDGIPAYGTDALRLTFLSLATQSRDIRFDLSRMMASRNFCNKLWNAARFTMMHRENISILETPQNLKGVDAWIWDTLISAQTTINQHIEDYRFDLAAKALYDFVWHEFCDWYLELIKPSLFSQDQSLKTRQVSILMDVLESILRIAHPMMPFITEEIWQALNQDLKTKSPSVMISSQAIKHFQLEQDAPQAIDWIKKIISAIRTIRSEMNIAPSQEISILIQGENAQKTAWLRQYQDLLLSLTKAKTMDYVTKAPSQAASAVVDELQLFVPLAGVIDLSAEKERLQKQLEKHQKEILRLSNKLNNAEFLARAPQEIVAKERASLKEISEIIDKMKAQIALLG